MLLTSLHTADATHPLAGPALLLPLLFLLVVLALVLAFDAALEGRAERRRNANHPHTRVTR
ncbi:MAG TPA: hypothetical protein VD970_09620 [Acetobacteraceae bacterium]|nr:hypothetical protein [Acetobacteraceae bacterium]